MMVILFSPSEGKREGGELSPINKSSLIFPESYHKRKEVIECYQKIISEGSNKALEALFGIKDTREFERYKIPFHEAPCMKAVLRYDGVAYDYLNYPTLLPESQHYIDTNVILFSNLFGPIKAGDEIPDYKLKQGASLEGVAPEKFYKEYFSDPLDVFINNQEVLDLRAGFYDKFYIPKKPITTLKFLKEGKVVSHWAKAYRGVVLREAAIHKVETIEGFLALNIEGLSVREIQQKDKGIEIIYNILK
jgi:cytoplasmic iron level regulating protein YaaA (DUF328/UPF0246 family)